MFSIAQLTSMAGVQDSAASIAIDEANESAVAVLDHPMVQSDETEQETEVDEYLALLTEESEETEETDNADMVILYTTNPMGDLPGTIILDSHVGEYNGRVVRALGCSASDVEAQQASSRNGSRFICFSEASWQTIMGDTSEQEPEQEPEQEQDTEQDTEQEQEQEQETEQEQAPEPEQEIPTEILEAQRLAQEAQAQADALKALMEQVKAAQEQARLAQERAKAAKEKAPILITPEIREKLDRWEVMNQLDEQGRAKAIANGLIWFKLPNSPKKDTGTIRNVTRTPNSSGVIEVHHHGSNGTSTTSAKTVPAAMAELVRAIKTEIANYEHIGIKVRHTDIARKLDVQSKADKKSLADAAKLVFNIHAGKAYAEIS